MTTEGYDRRTVLRRGGAALAAVWSAGCTGQPAAERTVEMTAGFAFEPEAVTVRVGGTVTWANASDVDHTVTADEGRIPEGSTYFASGGFESERAARANLRRGLVAPGERYEHAFDRPGAYGYYCIPHGSSGMTGTVRVE